MRTLIARSIALCAATLLAAVTGCHHDHDHDHDRDRDVVIYDDDHHTIHRGDYDNRRFDHDGRRLDHDDWHGDDHHDDDHH